MTREELKAHCEKQIEMCEMWAISKGEKPSGKIYEEHKLILELLDQQPYDDAISRQAACDAIRKYKSIVSNPDAYDKAFDDGIDTAIAEIGHNVPPVTPQQKYGKWEWAQYDYNPKLGNWHCSECRSVVIECVNKEEKDGIPLYKYCPQCGAKMQESEGV